MSYSTIASNIKTKASSVNTAKNKIKSSSFDSIWKGSAHDTLIADLKDTITKIGDQKESSDKFADALLKIDKYKKNKEFIEIYRDKINSLVDTDKNKYSNAVRRNKYNNKIENYTYLNSCLKKEINAILNSITSVSSEFDVVNYDSSVDDSNEYVVNIQDFLTTFNTKDLRTLGASNSNDDFFDYYTQENFESRMSEIKSQYSGRDAAVNCALGAMEMAAKVGGKLNLGWGPDFNDDPEVKIGAKYNSFASWAVNQGSLNNITASGIINAGNNTDYENAQKGDVLVSSTGNIVMIVDNNTDDQQFVVAEVGGESGVVVQAKSYASLTGNYRALDLSTIYND